MSKQLSRQQTRQTQRRERKEELRRRELARQAARRRRNFIFAGAIVSVVVVVGVILALNWSGLFPSTNPTNPTNPLYPPVDNIRCDSLEQTAFHIHAHLTIYVDGQQVNVPQGVGIASDTSCYYWLHTHDTTGVIHIEAPAASSGYTLGTFLKEWREVFTNLQYPTQLSATNGWTVYIDGKAHGSDFNSIKLTSHELITLAYNSPGITPDSTYNWTSDLAQ